MFGTALQFDAVDYVEVLDNTILDFGTDDSFSVEAWVKTTAKNDMIILAKRVHDSWDNRYLLFARMVGLELRAVFYLGDGSKSVYCQGTTDISDSEWHHVVGVRNKSTGTVRIYVDGTPSEQQLGDPTGDISNTANLWIGRQDYTNYPSWQGLIDEVRIYNGALSDNMIANHALGYYECSIDIKPGNDPNSINLGEQGKLTVAILGSLHLDVNTIDPTTIMLGGRGPVTRGKAQKLAISFENVNGDNHTDLVAHFSVQSLVGNGSLDENTTLLTLKAELVSGLGIIGIDSVRVVPPQ